MTPKFAIQFALVAGLVALAPVGLPAAGLTIARGLSVENPPQDFTKKKPKAQDFNLLLRDFLKADFIDVGKDTIDPKLTELYSPETSNDLYRRLKLNENKYRGSILVGALAIGDEQIITVSARIIHKSSGTKTLYSEYIQIVFSSDGKFKAVRKGLSTQQEL